jgi:hypothetical protein
MSFVLFYLFNFSEEHTAFIFRTEGGGSMFSETLVLTNKAHGVTNQKITMDIVTTVRTSKKN